MKIRSTAAVLCLAFFAAPLLAQPHMDRQNGFRLTPPKGWKKTKSEHFKVFFVSEDESANIGVTIQSVGEKVEAVAFLDSVEEQMGVANIMEGEDKQLEAEVLTQVGAEDGAMGVFLRGEGADQLRQLLFVFTKGTRVFTVIITVREAEKEIYRQISKDVMNSFKLL